jgi:hypothetical protein
LAGPGGEEKPKPEPEGDSHFPRLQDIGNVAVPLGLAVVVAVFIALGIEGDLRARLIRNDPRGVATAFVFCIVGATLPLLARIGRSFERTATFIGGFLLLAGAVIAVARGVPGLGEREQPSLAVERVMSESDDSFVTLKISASGLSLASEDRMLLRVVAFTPGTTPEEARNACSPTQFDPGDAVGDPVFWGESGPTATGTTTNSITLTMPRDRFRYVCAYSGLSGDPNTKDPRLSISLLDLERVGTAPSETQSNTDAASPN